MNDSGAAMTFTDARIIATVLRGLTIADVRVVPYDGALDQWCVEVTPAGRDGVEPLRIVVAEYDL